jgi:hypothetical protein
MKVVGPKFTFAVGDTIRRKGDPKFHVRIVQYQQDVYWGTAMTWSWLYGVGSQILIPRSCEDKWELVQ